MAGKQYLCSYYYNDGRVHKTVVSASSSIVARKKCKERTKGTVTEVKRFN
jgi:hypothetical protein